MAIAYSLDNFSTSRFDADGNRMEVSHLESADCIPTYTQDTVLALYIRTDRHTMQLRNKRMRMYVLTAGLGLDRL